MKISHSKEPPAVQSLYRYNYQNEKADRTLVFSRSDALPGKLPQKRGENSTYSQVERDDSQSRYWRGLVGTFIAHRLRLESNEPWHIKDWPDGYTFWVTTRKTGELDRYLYGWKRQFRSPQEFAFHAWFLYDDKENAHGCRCLVCTGRKQGEINEIELGKEPPVAPSKAHRTNEDRGNNYAAPLLPAVHVDDSRTAARKLHHHNFKNSLYDVIPLDPPEFAKRTAQLGEILRPREIVWVSIPPIMPHDPSRTDLVIEMWPAYIRSSPDVSSSKRQYPVVFLYANNEDEELVDESKILPYKAYSWPKDLIHAIQKHSPRTKLSKDLRELIGFPALPLAGHSSTQLPRSFENALSAFSVATLIGDEVAATWSPSDCWKRSRDESPGEGGSVEMWYHGMWLGTERIWWGDLVRLSLTREELEDEGLGDGLKEASPQAKNRGLLLFVTAIKSDGEDSEPEATISGSLYEVTSDRFRDPPSRITQPVPEERLPTPPNGFRFRKITPNGKEIRLPVHYLAGRYDGHSLVSSLIRDLLRRGGFMATSRNHSSAFVREATERVEACASLNVGNLMPQVKKYKSSRHLMINDARKESQEFCYQRWLK